ncbi:34382_t:CDS:2, partial [Racocetra persica]
VEKILERTPLIEDEKEETKFSRTFRLKQRKELKGRNLITPEQIIQYNLPLDIALYLNYYISKIVIVTKDSASITQMYNNLNTLIDCLTNLERVLRSPIPFAYAIHLFHTTWIFCLSLPFQLVGDLDWVTVPIVFLTSLILLGVDEIADEIENPFGTDPNDLAIDKVSEHGDKGAKKEMKGGIMEYWWTEAKHAVEKPKNQAKINASKQEVDEIKSNHEKE